jgi:riboflavin kinase / FMN adenylyltransferase
MRVFRSSLEAAGQLRIPAVAIGNFDGVHRGHQALFARAQELARAVDGQAVALTFGPHPARFFNPELAPPLITTEAQKLAAMEECGLDAVVIEPFDAAFAARTPETFAREILAQRLGAHDVVVGQGFTFGAKRAGSLESLCQLGTAHGFVAHELETVRVGSIAVSSSKIREFVFLGRVGGASMLLGRDYLVEGRVVPGKARGRTIGLPTANVDAENEIVPRKGVYAGWARLPDDTIRKAVINIGTNPTFAQADAMSLEVHILDYSGDLYGRRLGVLFTQRLREEKCFPSVDALITAIHHDIQEALQLLGAPASSLRAAG